MLLDHTQTVFKPDNEGIRHHELCLTPLNELKGLTAAGETDNEGIRHHRRRGSKFLSKPSKYSAIYAAHMVVKEGRGVMEVSARERKRERQRRERERETDTHRENQSQRETHKQR
jgi:hypothetical protein